MVKRYYKLLQKETPNTLIKLASRDGKVVHLEPDIKQTINIYGETMICWHEKKALIILVNRFSAFNFLKTHDHTKKMWKTGI